MSLYKRTDSPYWWVKISVKGGKAVRLCPCCKSLVVGRRSTWCCGTRILPMSILQATQVMWERLDWLRVVI